MRRKGSASCPATVRQIGRGLYLVPKSAPMPIVTPIARTESALRVEHVEITREAARVADAREM